MLAIVGALFMSIGTSALAADPPGLAPARPWTVDYDADSCALRRMFGAGDDQAYLEMRRFGPGLSLQTILAHNRMKPGRPANFRFRYGSESDWRDVNGANTITLDNGFNGVLFEAAVTTGPEYEEIEDPLERATYLTKIDFRTIEQNAAAGVQAITLRGAFRKELTLQIGAFDKPLAALNTCIAELMTHWGIDVEAHKTLTRSASPVNLPEVGGMIDYPPKMIQRNLQGVVNIRLDIDASGLITGCHIQMPLSDPAFEATSCLDIQHALDFEPALDKDGEPIRSYWVTKVIFQLGG